MGTIGSGNVFADLGLPDDETRLLKAKLVSKVDDVIVKRSLSDGAAGAIMGLSRQKVSELRNGRTDDYSVERLYEFLNSLGVTRLQSTGSAEGDDLWSCRIRWSFGSEGRALPQEFLKLTVTNSDSCAFVCERVYIS